MEQIFLRQFPGIKHRTKLVKEGKESGNVQVSPLSNPEAAYEYARDGFQDKDREMFVAILLNTKNLPIGVNLVSVGGLDHSVAHPREVFKAAILASAHAIILAHNHPSGDPTPSAEDFRITKTLKEVGKIVGIDVVDHIIVAGTRYYSMSADGKF